MSIINNIYLIVSQKRIEPILLIVFLSKSLEVYESTFIVLFYFRFVNDYGFLPNNA